MMWRKNEEAKPSSPGSKSSEPTAAAPKQNQSAISSVSTPEASAPAATSSSAVPPTTALATESSKVAAAPTTASPAISAAPAAPTSSSTIGAGLKIRGDISGNSNLVIEGDVQGKVQMANGRVTVAASGHVNADIEASEISIDGHVQGNLMATENVRLGATSHVQGSILTRRIAIEDGASLRGKVEMIRAGDSSATATEQSSKATSPKAAAAGKQGN
jgi:cytoskeletal protein CcmA (bactofilin family)